MSTQLDFMRDSQREMDDLLREIDEVRQDQGDNWRQSFPELLMYANFLSEAPPRVAANLFDEIPRDDPTFRQLGAVLIPHTRYKNMKLLEFRTFTGGMAYQPCCKDIDLMGLFKAFQPIERSGDHLFKVARAWSCIIQSLDNLPKELRWILATIYNFSSEMLRPHVSEDDLWRLRPWLMHWYDVADAFLEFFDIPASAPVPDWFLRPSEATDDLMEPEVEARLTLCRTNSVTSDDNQTVLHHSPPCQGTRPNFAAEFGHSLSVPQSGISAWIAAQPDWNFRMQSFDLAPGGFVTRRRNSGHSSSPPLGEMPYGNPFRLNPEATEFDPNLHEATSTGSVSSKAASNWSRASTPSLADFDSGDEDGEWLEAEASSLPL